MASMILPSQIEEAAAAKFIRETEEVFPKLEKLIGMKINWDKFEYLELKAPLSRVRILSWAV